MDRMITRYQARTSKVERDWNLLKITVVFAGRFVCFINGDDDIC